MFRERGHSHWVLWESQGMAAEINETIPTGFPSLLHKRMIFIKIMFFYVRHKPMEHIEQITAAKSCLQYFN
jgi:hypothetical protein